MNAKKEIFDELNSLSPTLAGMDKSPLGSVPEGYFDAFPLEMTSRVADFTKEAPDGYFDSFPARLMEKIRAEEERSPVLHKVGKENVFTIPGGYFENLPAEIIAKVKTPAKVVSMNMRSVARYAVAAVVTGLLGLAIFNFPGKNSAYDREYASIVREGLSIAKNADFDAVLQTVSDNEIEEYLNESGIDVDAALVAAASMEESSLPAAEDLLFDENTLDEYLKELNINDLN